MGCPETCSATLSPRLLSCCLLLQANISFFFRHFSHLLLLDDLLECWRVQDRLQLLLLRLLLLVLVVQRAVGGRVRVMGAMICSRQEVSLDILWSTKLFCQTTTATMRLPMLSE